MSTPPSPFARPSGPPEGDRPPAGPVAPRDPEPPPTSRSTTSTRRPTRRRTPRWPVVLVVVLAVLAVLAGAIWLRSRSTDSPRQPADQARRYLQAVADGDSRTALSLGRRTEGPLLTPEALRASRAQAPITDITVVDPGRSDLTATEVVLGYRLGGRLVQGSFPMARTPEGAWLLQRTTRTVRIAPEPKMVPVVLDGIALRSTGYTYTVEIFPGAHTLGTGSPWLDFSRPIWSVDGLGAGPDPDSRLAPTAAYPDKLRERVAARLKQCLASTELAPAGCPWARRARADQPVRPGSVRYTLLDQRLEVPTPGPVDAIAHGVDRLRVRLQAETETAGQTRVLEEVMETDARFAVDLLSTELDFVWE